MSQLDSIGKYRVIAKLGQGGMARVLLTAASGPAGFNKLMVVKELREELSAEPEFLTMFLDEARLAARLNHPNVVTTYEVVTEGDRHYIAMDYLDGQPLNRLIHRIGYAQLPLDVHLRIICDALEGLHYAHTLTDFDSTPLDVVHRDVSPHNIFVTYDGQVKLVDFGVAKAAGAAAQTQTGVFKGKIRYMAPEQAQAEHVDLRADIYSVGVMLWEALAKRSISKGQRDLVTLHLRIEDEEPTIREVAPDAPPALLAICERAKSFLPDNRYESAEALRCDIDDWLEQRGHVGSKDIAALVTSAFTEERAEIKTIIEEQMRGSASMPPPALPSVAELAADTPLLSLDEQSVTAKRFATQQSIAPDKRSSPTMWLLAATAVVSLGALALFALRDNGSAMPAPTATPASSIELTVKAHPQSASITVDGIDVSDNPYNASVASDDSRHLIEVSEDGFTSEKRWVTYDRDLTLSFSLVPTTAPSAAPSASASASAPRPAPAFPQSAPPASPKSVGDGRATPKQGNSDGPRAIDEDNPYK